jgi:drug/metabolite transporter (DMT)-like permease
MCVTVIALLPFAAGSATLPSPRTTIVLLALGAIGTGAALALFYMLIQRMSATRAGIAFYLAPGFAVLYGAVFLHDKLTPAILAGLTMITTGSLPALATRRPPTRSPKSRPTRMRPRR